MIKFIDFINLQKEEAMPCRTIFQVGTNGLNDLSKFLDLYYYKRYLQEIESDLTKNNNHSNFIELENDKVLQATTYAIRDNMDYLFPLGDLFINYLDNLLKASNKRYCWRARPTLEEENGYAKFRCRIYWEEDDRNE